MAARSEAEARSILIYKSQAWKGGVLSSAKSLIIPIKAHSFQADRGPKLYRTGCAQIVAGT